MDAPTERTQFAVPGLAATVPWGEVVGGGGILAFREKMSERSQFPEAGP